MLQTTSRLALLIQMLGITGNDLANSVGIDPSLISKWKNNRRRIPGRTDTMQKIAVYLLALDDEQGGRTIRPLLDRLVKNQPISPEDSVDLLTQWLFEADQPDWYPGAGKNTEIRLDQNSYVCPIEVFLGVDGRRNAVLRFMDEIMPLPGGHKLCLMMQDDISWLENDRAFNREFMGRLADWLASGHELDVIHWVDHKPDHLQSIVRQWLPIHLDNKVNSWYYPIYDEVPFPMSCLVVPGQLSIIGSMSDQGVEDYHTVMYSDPATIRQCEWFFSSMQKRCAMLVENYASDQIHLIARRFAENWQTLSRKVVSLHSVLPLTLGLPKEAMLRIFAENSLDDGVRDHLLLHWTNYGSSKFPGRTSGNRLRVIHQIEAIESVLAQSDYVDPMLSVLAGQPVKVANYYFRELLLAMSKSVISDSTYEIALARKELFDRSVWPNFLVISNSFFTAWGSRQEQNQLFGREATMVHAFERYFNECWQQTPRVNRNPLIVSGQLEELSRC